MKKTFKIKLTLQKISFLFYFFIFLIAMASLSYLTLFLYKNLYDAITQTEEILMLRGGVMIETVDINKFEEVVKKIEEKTAGRIMGTTNNPFD